MNEIAHPLVGLLVSGMLGMPPDEVLPTLSASPAGSDLTFRRGLAHLDRRDQEEQEQGHAEKALVGLPAGRPSGEEPVREARQKIVQGAKEAENIGEGKQ